MVIAGCVLAVTLYSQTSINTLYQDFSRENNVTKVNLGGLVMAFARPFVENKMSSKISSISVLSLDECSPEVKARFNRSALNFRDKDYELFVSSNDEDEKVRIFLKFHKDAIREMVVMTMGESPALVRLKGKISPADIESLSNEQR